ncbi:MAG: [protein-PII] uridylyltransferase [Acinetobacter sp.]|nr:MAG: [protein-PII] uridylyltransferase [Acinetobacter sp.]
MLELAALSDYVSLGQNDLKGINTWRSTIEEQLDHAFQMGTSIRQIIAARSEQIDFALEFLWQYADLHNSTLGLFAVGGYGRQEMLPYSDVDILILSEDELDPTTEAKIRFFVATLWDVGQFKPGISVRTLKSCFEQAQADLTIATSLIEARFLTGHAHLKQYPRRIVSESWSDQTFFDAKMQEQSKRYQQHHHTESNLEPDIKNAPGGLRDIHQIGWIAKRHFRVQRIYDLVHLGFISEFELGLLEQAESFLWEIRHHLHRLKKRDENRLLFDYQREIASIMGYSRVEGQHPNHAIEQFMKRYYRTAQTVSTLNELLLHYFNEAVITPRLPDYQRKITELNQNFKLVDDKLAVTHHKVFSESPSAILEVFYLMANRPEILGIRARTLRLLLLAAKKIDHTFRENPEHQALFLAIIRSPYRLYDTMVAMKRYGVLGQYIPVFGNIIGLMQYDLFHIYTVDAHTLLLIRHLSRFSEAETSKHFPVVSHVFQRIQRKDILFLAALFHDIAKGRGGDHSELGAIDAIAFCRQHGLSERDSKMVAWLTQSHLAMSLTAQKKDISDPDVVQAFAELMGDMEHLDYLYCLTVADINSTNPALWTNWKASLLRQLYAQTREVIRTGIDRPVDHQMLIEDTKFSAMDKLIDEFTTEAIDAVWQELGDDYFLKESAEEIIWHTSAILRHADNPNPLVLIREHRKAIQLFIYTRDTPNLFARTVTILDHLNLDVQDARIITAATNFSLDTYVIQDRSGILMTDQHRMNQMIDTLIVGLRSADFPKIIQRMLPRQLRHFDVETTIDIRLNHALQQTMLEISTLDRPGLLARIGHLFVQQGLDIHSAKIATLGEKAEDIFFVTKQDGTPLDDTESAQLAEQMKSSLDAVSS